MTKKWIEVNDLSSGLYSVNKNIRSGFRDYSNAYIVVTWAITVEGDNDAKKRTKNVTFKNNPPFRSCIWKFNSTFIYNAEDLNIVMPMYNLLKRKWQLFYEIRKFVKLL